MGVASYDIAAADDLKNVGVTMSNAAMEGTSALFVQDDAGVIAAADPLPDVSPWTSVTVSPDLGLGKPVVAKKSKSKRSKSKRKSARW